MSSILLIWDRLGDYHRARVMALRHAYTKGQVYTADLGSGDDLYKWEDTNEAHRHFVLSGKPVHRFDFFKRITSFSKIVKEKEVDILGIAGYGHMEYLAMIVLGKLKGKQIILFAESWYAGNKTFNWLKGAFLQLFIDGFFVSGTRAEKHFNERLGIPKHKIRTGYSVVDNDHFRRPLSSSLPAGVSTKAGPHLRISASPYNDQNDSATSTSRIHPSTLQPYLLSVARYSPEKNLSFLIKAYRNSHVYRKWKLVLVGDGPQREKLKQIIGTDHDYILLSGWKSYMELPQWYHNARAFVLPSLFEPWGLVVNEAMAAGLPVLVSDRCGCTPDLVLDGNGWRFDPMARQEFEVLLNRIGILEKHEFNQMGFQGEQIMSKYTPDHWSDRFIDFLS